VLPRGVLAALDLPANILDLLSAELGVEVQPLAPHASAGRIGHQLLNPYQDREVAYFGSVLRGSAVKSLASYNQNCPPTLYAQLGPSGWWSWSTSSSSESEPAATRPAATAWSAQCVPEAGTIPEAAGDGAAGSLSVSRDNPQSSRVGSPYTFWNRVAMPAGGSAYGVMPSPGAGSSTVNPGTSVASLASDSPRTKSAMIAGVLPEGKRSFAFGLFYLGYGGGWLAGSIVTGFLYGWSLDYLVAFLMVVQLLSLPIFFVAIRAKRRSHKNA